MREAGIKLQLQHNQFAGLGEVMGDDVRICSCDERLIIAQKSG